MAVWLRTHISCSFVEASISFQYLQFSPSFLFPSLPPSLIVGAVHAYIRTWSLVLRRDAAAGCSFHCYKMVRTMSAPFAFIPRGASERAQHRRRKRSRRMAKDVLARRKEGRKEGVGRPVGSSAGKEKKGDKHSRPIPSGFCLAFRDGDRGRGSCRHSF